jgi:hypothetical protein
MWRVLYRHYLKQLHSVKTGKHLAKTLPIVTLGKESLANGTSTTASLPSNFYRTLGKYFFKCQSVLDNEKSLSRVTELEV